MPTRNVVLTDHQNALVDRLIESGRYQNASEALRAGLRYLEDEEERGTLLRQRLRLAHEAIKARDLAPGIGRDAFKSALRDGLENAEAGNRE